MIFNLQGAGTDLELELVKSKKYYDWLNEGKDENLQTHIFFDSSGIPVGTIEFVESILGPQKPLDISPWIHREHREFEDVCPARGYVKSMTKLKDPLNGIWEAGESHPGKWFWTEEIKGVTGEYRVFLGRNGEILDVRNYVGWKNWPSAESLIVLAGNIFDCYDRPLSFDVMLTKTDDIHLLEIHDYFALGLYGFSDPAKLPFLINDWYKNK